MFDPDNPTTQPHARSHSQSAIALKRLFYPPANLIHWKFHPSSPFPCPLFRTRVHEKRNNRKVTAHDDDTMKPSALQPMRRANSFRSPSSAPIDGGAAPSDGPLLRSPTALFWLLLHALCCLVSLALGFRFSRLLFLLLFSPSPSPSSPPSPPFLLLHRRPDLALSPPPPTFAAPNATASRVVVGRHGILVRPWPHPNHTEVMRAHRILDCVQREQRLQYGVKSPRPLLVVTPTYPRTFQALHLTGLLHSLPLIPYPLTWLVVDAAGVGAASNETAALLARSRVPVLRIPFSGRMPLRWSDRHRTEARMRLHALRSRVYVHNNCDCSPLRTPFSYQI